MLRPLRLDQTLITFIVVQPAAMCVQTTRVASSTAGHDLLCHVQAHARCVSHIFSRRSILWYKSACSWKQNRLQYDLKGKRSIAPHMRGIALNARGRQLVAFICVRLCCTAEIAMRAVVCPRRHTNIRKTLLNKARPRLHSGGSGK
eukprot:3328128-Pleurochrysis_carterae.AAC.2